MEFCRKRLTEEEANELTSAIAERYWYQMYLDELSLVGVVGEMHDGKAMLWTHKKFDILYNHNQIVGVSLGTSDPIEVAADVEVIYTYEVRLTSQLCKC
ncbi:unnamed protein product [Hydatigera taeniaeformis]|uniref:Transmembrane 9 superfamily member n=1 Tax=Hydatigena taeniaeformis TaxID=6205 RepID=A0A0R3WVL0_HYDTA|nr:unnamed protein product [Hydatigera taeniaeformis]